MKLSTLLDPRELLEDIQGGYVQVRKHPTLPLSLYGYTPKAQYEQRWTHATSQARGLIVDDTTDEVVARPFAKFFNYGDPAVGSVDLDAPIVGAFDKADGSLGIAYPTPDGWELATRGSFTSEQAMHGARHLHEFEHTFALGHTPLFEIVYPDNRIVLDYAGRDALIPLGSMDIESGEFAPSGESYGSSLREVLALPPRANAEGFVVWLTTSRAVKVKQEDYLELHRAVSNFTVKEVWRHLRDDTYASFVAGLPDEFHEQSDNWAADLRGEFNCHFDLARSFHAEVVALALPTRRDQALWLRDKVTPDVMWRVFALLDGRDISESIWRSVEPKLAQ